MARTSKDSASTAKKIATQPPALSPEEREQQMISLATSEAERQMRDHTASSQVIVHYLKLGSMREQEELEKLKRENALLAAKCDMLKSAQRTEELFSKVMDAVKKYSGDDGDEQDI